MSGAAPLDPRLSREEALAEYAILDSDTEARFDTLTKVAAMALGLPMALISIVDGEREWVKSAYGVESNAIPNMPGMSAETVELGEPLAIADATIDPRFCEHPLVTGRLAIRSFLGVPLEVHSGHRLGTLAVLGSASHIHSSRDTELLEALAVQVVELLELRRTEAQLEATSEKIRTLATLIPICSHCRKVRNEDRHWSTLERLVQAKTGSRFTHGICPDCVREHYPDAAEELLARTT